MAKKKIEIKKEYLEKVLNDKITIIYTEEERKRNLEEDIDDKVKDALKKVFGTNIIAKKTGIQEIDREIPAYHGDEGNGHPDVMVFNYFGKNEIDMIIENIIKADLSLLSLIFLTICFNKILIINSP